MATKKDENTVVQKTTKGKNGETIRVTETVKKKTYTPEEYQKVQEQQNTTNKVGGSGAIIKLIIVIVILIVLALMGLSVYKNYQEANKLKGRVTADVAKGTIYKTIDTSGTLNSSLSEKITSSVSSTVTKVNYTQGQEVRAGAVLLELDPTYAKTRISNTEKALKDMKNMLEIYKTKSDQLSIAAEQAGFVKDVRVTQGASVNAGDIIAYFVPTTAFRCVYNVTYDELKKVEQWQPVTVTYDGGTASGVVYDITGNSTNGSIVQVGVYMTDSKINLSGKTTTAQITTVNGTVESNGASNVFVASAIPVYAKQSGTVGNIYTDEKAISKGTIIASMKNDEIVAKIAEFESAIAQLQQNSAYLNANLDSYKVYAQSGGIIQTEALKVGDTVVANKEIITIQTSNVIQAQTSVLSTDIDKVIVGQGVNLYTTVDGKTVELKGNVTGKENKLIISDVIQQYKVSVTLNQASVSPEIIGKEAKIGIILEAKNNVLYVPTELVYGSEGNKYVYVLKGEDFSRRDVKVGIANSQYTEITAGLEEKEKIISEKR